MKKKLCIFGGLLLLIAAGVCVLLFWKKASASGYCQAGHGNRPPLSFPRAYRPWGILSFSSGKRDGKAMEHCEEITDAFVEQVISTPPDALLLSGI